MYFPVLIKSRFVDNQLNRFSDREIKGRFLQPDIDFPTKQISFTAASSTALTGVLSDFLRLIEGDFGYVGLTADQDVYFQLGFGPVDPVAASTTSPVLWAKSAYLIIPVYLAQRIAARGVSVSGTLIIIPMA